jgi:uncharacterized membrane protein (DUF106 family)
VIWTLHRALGGIFDVILYPFRTLPPVVGLAAVSLLVSIGLLIGFKATSDQEALAAAKRRIHACVFEIRLFNDDLRAILRAQVGILRHTLSYFRLSIVPMAWLMIPLVVILIQLQFHYGYGGLEPGQSAIVKATMTDEGAVRARETGDIVASLEAAAGMRVETPLLWIPSLGEADWRVVAERPGSYDLSVRVGERSFSKLVLVTDDVVRRAPVRPRTIPQQLLNPVEVPLPAGAPIESITIGYPDADVSLLGWRMHWLVAFFILTLVFALALQRPLGVRL